MQKNFQIPSSVLSGPHVFRDLADAFLDVALSVVKSPVHATGITCVLVLTLQKNNTFRSPAVVEGFEGIFLLKLQTGSKIVCFLIQRNSF